MTLAGAIDQLPNVLDFIFCFATTSKSRFCASNEVIRERWGLKSSTKRIRVDVPNVFIRRFDGWKNVVKNAPGLVKRLLESVGAASVRISRTESRILRSVLMTLFSARRRIAGYATAGEQFRAEGGRAL
jgi:hypothetical protein